MTERWPPLVIDAREHRCRVLEHGKNISAFVTRIEWLGEPEIERGGLRVSGWAIITRLRFRDDGTPREVVRRSQVVVEELRPTAERCQPHSIECWTWAVRCKRCSFPATPARHVFSASVWGYEEPICSDCLTPEERAAIADFASAALGQWEGGVESLAADGSGLAGQARETRPQVLPDPGDSDLEVSG